jgi:protein arginine kinase activator
MKCDHCDQSATLHLTQVVNGKVTKKHLCASCAKAAGLGTEAVASVADYLLGQGGVAPGPLPSNKVCPRCRMTLTRLRKEGRLGCPDCYVTFAEELARILESTHGAAQHRGRHPRKASGAWQAELEALELRLSEAVAAEAFEDAARLRDALRLLREEHAEGSL